MDQKTRQCGRWLAQVHSLTALTCAGSNVALAGAAEVEAADGTVRHPPPRVVLYLHCRKRTVRDTDTDTHPSPRPPRQSCPTLPPNPTPNHQVVSSPTSQTGTYMPTPPSTPSISFAQSRDATSKRHVNETSSTARSRTQQAAAWSSLWGSDENDLWDRGMPSPALIDFVESRPEALCAPATANGGRLRALVPVRA